VLRRNLVIRGYFYDARVAGMGGWTLDVHHQFDPEAGILELGSGERRYVKGFDSALVASILNPNVTSGDQHIFSFREGSPQYMAAAPDGSVLFWDVDGRLMRLSRDRSQLTPVLPQALSGQALAVGGDGTVYFSGWNAQGNGSVHRLRHDGQWTNVQAPETLFFVSKPEGLAVADDGTLYVAASLANRVYRYSTAGVLSEIAGAGTAVGDGQLALESQILSPNAVAVAPTARSTSTTPFRAAPAASGASRGMG
jgi:hypothetical protein